MGLMVNVVVAGLVDLIMDWVKVAVGKGEIEGVTNTRTVVLGNIVQLLDIVNFKSCQLINHWVILPLDTFAQKALLST
jgi:hypothetical protein